MKVLRDSSGIVLVLGIVLFFSPSSSAAGPVITADGTTCTLANAILTSNTNVNTGGCVAVGPQAIDDTIELTYDVTLTTKDPTAGEEEDEEHGSSGLPEILGHATINAHGHTIQRDPELFSAANGGDGADPCSGTGEKFRVFHVGYPGGNMTLNDATVSNGCSEEWGGGGFLFEGHDLDLNRVVVMNNRAVMGGGILAHESTTVLTDSALTGNSAIAGGGLYARTGTVKFLNSTVAGNSATGVGAGTVCVESLYIKSCLPLGAGGAIGLNGGTTTVNDSTVSGNFAVSGGGIYNGGATVVVTRATLTQNTATNGGVLFSERGAASMTNATVFQNSAVKGGVIYNNNTGSTKVVHGTLVENTATSGGGVFATNKKLVTLSNTLLENPAGGSCAFSGGGTVNSTGYNRSTDGTCGLTLATDQQNVADLKLGNLADDGTPGGARFPLLAGSPAIDKGSPDGTTADQMGQLRLGTADIGAIEYPRFVIVWLGGKTSADKNLRVDLLAEVFVDGVPATPASQLPAALIGGIGFANATLYTVPVPAVDVPSGSSLQLKLSARRPCSAAGPTFGTVRLWYDGQPDDTPPGQDAGSRLGATAAGETTFFFLRGAFALSTTAGPGGAANQFVEAGVNSATPCTGSGRPFVELGTWSVTIL